MKAIKTYEEFIGDMKLTKKKSKKIASVNTNGDKKYDQAADGSDSINRSPLNGNR